MAQRWSPWWGWTHTCPVDSRGLKWPAVSSVNRLPGWAVKGQHTAGSRVSIKLEKKDTLILQNLLPYLYGYINLFLSFWSLSPAAECTCCEIPAHYENTNFFSYQWDLSAQNLLLGASKIFSIGRSSVMNLCSWIKAFFHLLRSLVIIQGLTVTCMVEKPVHWK